MTDWLIQHEFAYKRPKKIPGKLDPEKQRIFIEQYMALKETLNPDEEIYFIDAVHPEHQSQANHISLIRMNDTSDKHLMIICHITIR